MSTTVPPSATATPAIAIVGVSAIFPGSSDANGFWSDILAGKDMVTDVPASHWLIEDYYDEDPKAPDKTYCRRGAFLSDVDFEPLRFGVPPSIVPATDTSQLLALIVAQRVLEDALGKQFEDADRARVSVILGVTSGQELLATMVSRLQRPVWIKSLRDAGIPESKAQEVCERISNCYVPWQESTFPGLLGNVVAGRIANRLDLGGTNCVTDAACASAFSATSMAISELYLGQADLVITGGVDTLNDIFMYMCFSKTPALSATGDCRPFSDQADGTLLGEGLSMVALKRLEDAERDGDRIYAVLRGLGASSDGRAKSVYAPRAEGQARALRRAYDVAGYGPDTVELVEAHGTATKAGDAAEFGGLRMVFENGGRDDKQWCALGSVKSQIGHTKAASGAAGLFKAVMALQHGILPPTIKVDKPNPALAIEQSPFYLNTEARPWVRPSDHPRRASVSSFGFGGSNFHIALEEYRGHQSAFRQRTADNELIVMEAASAEQLVTQLKAIEVAGQRFLQWFARTQQEAWTGQQPARLAFSASDDGDLRNKLQEAAERIAAQPAQSFSTPRGLHYGCARETGKTAFLFPGQGSQYLGMGGALAMTYGQALGAWDQAADLNWGEGPRLDQVVFPKPVFDDEARKRQADTLVRTEWAQPAIGAVSLSQLRLLRLLGIQPNAVAGHSYGEVTALHAAGAIDADTMLSLARTRGELMAQAARAPGAMLAITATIEQVAPLLAATATLGAAGEVVMANHNAPKQVVVSGAVEAIDRFEAQLATAGLRTKRLAVATAFHSKIVAPACIPFGEALAAAAVKPPTTTVYANSTAAPYPSNADGVRELLAGQIGRPVRFVEQIEAMYAAGVRTFIEVGPGSVLTGLVGRILGKRPHLAVALDRKGKRGLTAWHTALGKLAAAGLAIDFAPLWAGYRADTDPSKRPQPKMTLSINGSNYGKPYPPAEGAKALPPPNPEITFPAPVPAPQQTAASEVIVSNSTHSNGSNDAHGAHGSNGAGYAAPTVAMAAPAVAPMAVHPLTNHGVLLQAYQEAQRHTAEAHIAFQNAMAQAHVAFLQSSERAFTGMATLAGGAPQPMMQAAPQLSYVAQQLTHAPVAPTVIHSVPIAQAPIAAPSAIPTAPPVAIPQAPVAAPAQPVAAPAPTVAPPVAQAPVQAAPTPVAPAVEAAAPVDAKQLLLDVVADKTGYPADMLSLDMALEADLGIDSIKRVEILSAMVKQRPDLPQVDTKVMARLNTLGEIVEYMDGKMADAGRLSGGETARPKASSAATP